MKFVTRRKSIVFNDTIYFSVLWTLLLMVDE
jgi:hypothetical protein